MRAMMCLILALSCGAASAAEAGAKFISVAGAVPNRPAKNDARVTECATAAFTKEFTCGKDVQSACLRTSGLGVYEAFVNGSPVKGGFLKPGFTSDKCRHVYSADVTKLVRGRKGERNLLAAEVATSWYADRIGGHYGSRTAFYGELVLKYRDGTEERIPTDATWKAAYAGPVVRSGIYYGETYDARRSDAYKTDAAASAAWAAAVVSEDFKGELRPVPGAIVHRRDDLTLKPVAAYVWQGVEGAAEGAFGRVRKVRDYKPGETMKLAKGETLVIDFGQNAAAVPEFAFAAAAGVELTARFGEMLNDANGEKSRGNDGPGGSVYVANMRSCPSRLDYTFAGGEATHSPNYTFWGYRYVSLAATGEVTFRSVASVPVTSFAKEDETGSLVTGNADVNRLVSNVRWGMYSNYVSIPTDCPQRDERMGWTADTQVFTETACYFADVRKFFDKWLADLRDCQRTDGGYPSVAPIAHWGNERSRLGWADAGVIVPWTIWRMTGSVKVLEDSWDSMVRFVDEIAARKYATATNDMQYADWLSFEKWESSRDGLWEMKNKSPEVFRWWSYLGGCYWLWDAGRMAEMGRALKKPEAERFAKMADVAREYMRREFLTADGDLIEQLRCQQTAHLFAIKLGLAPNEKAKKALCDRLVSLIEKNGNRLSTGFLGTSILMDTITEDVGRPDLAYTLLLQHDCPSWLYSVDQGATTIWERWNSYTKKDGFGPVAMNSFNHYAYGAVAAWLFKTAAGIRADPANPGFRHIILKPSPDRRLGSIDAKCRTANGFVRSAWRYEGGKWIWDIVIPQDACAEVYFPGADKPRMCTSGEHHYEVLVRDAAPDYPIRAANMRDVRVTGGFWFDRLATNRLVTLKTDFAKCSETPRIANFTNCANRAKGGKFGGIFFDDSDVYKVMEGAAYIYAETKDAELKKYMDWLISEVAKAQEPDGYLYTARTLGGNRAIEGTARWECLSWSHEFYNPGHMIEAAVAWYEATGETNFLAVARKNADLIDRTFGWEPGKLKMTSGHQEMELALCRLYRATGEKRYLNLAKFLLDVRGRRDVRPTWGVSVQDHQPVLEQEEALGHAVRAGYMYAGMADVAALTGDASYVKAIDRLWENVVGRKLHLNGGIGAGRETVHPKWGKAWEAFGVDYFLPNEDAYLETCAAIANALWNQRLFCWKGETKYVDVLERIIYNGFVSGISLSGDEFFYPNPLANKTGVGNAKKGPYRRSKWFGCSCCPVNDVRFMPQIPSFAYATDAKGTLYWNLFMQGEATVGGWKFKVDTDYPRSGKAKLTIVQPPTSNLQPAFKLRIPGWAVGKPVPSDLYAQTDPSSFMEILVEVNGLALNGCPGEDGYVSIGREWKKGDTVTVDIPMPVKRIRAHAKVEADRGRLAVERGPIVYCAEGADNAGKAFDAVLPENATFTDDAITIGDKTFPALKASNGLKLVPYCLWGNREPGNEMQCWFRGRE